MNTKCESLSKIEDLDCLFMLCFVPLFFISENIISSVKMMSKSLAWNAITQFILFTAAPGFAYTD